MTGAQSRKIHTKPEWAWSLTNQAHQSSQHSGVYEEDLVLLGDENMIREMPEEFNKVLEVQKSWKEVINGILIRGEGNKEHHD